MYQIEFILLLLILYGVDEKTRCMRRQVMVAMPSWSWCLYALRTNTMTIMACRVFHHQCCWDMTSRDSICSDFVVAVLLWVFRIHRNHY